MSGVSLPDDLFLSILSYLDSLSIARIQSVSRYWHHVAHSHPQLWRDALWIDRGIEHLPRPIPIIRRRIEALTFCSGGRLDRLAIRLPKLGSVFMRASIPDIEDIEYILRTLPSLRIRELWLECSCAPTSEPRAVDNVRGKDGRAIIQSPFDVDPDIAWSAVTQCFDLEKLYFAAPLFISRESLDWTQLSLSRLKRIHLEIGNINTLLKDDSLFNMLCSATHVTLKPYNSQFVPLQAVWRILEQASDTLEHIDIFVDATAGFDVRGNWSREEYEQQQQRRLAFARPTIYLPRLDSLSLVWSSSEFVPPGDTFCPVPDRQILCPALRDLSLESSHLRTILDDFLPQGTRSLRTLFLVRPGAGNDAAGVGRLLHDRCGTTLQRLTIVNHSADIVKELVCHPSMVWNDLTIVDEMQNMLVDLVRSRQLHSSYDPIHTLYLVSDKQDISAANEDTVAWLRRNVPNFVFHNVGSASPNQDELDRRVYRHINYVPLLQRRADQSEPVGRRDGWPGNDDDTLDEPQDTIMAG